MIWPVRGEVGEWVGCRVWRSGGWGGDSLCPACAQVSSLQLQRPPLRGPKPAQKRPDAQNRGSYPARARFKEHSASIAELRNLHLRILRRVIVRGDRGDCGLEWTRWPVSAATHAAAASADAASLAPEGGSLLTVLLRKVFSLTTRTKAVVVLDSSCRIAVFHLILKLGHPRLHNIRRCVDASEHATTGSPLKPAIFKHLHFVP